MELKPGYKQTEVGVIPLDWEVKRLGDIANIQRGASPRPIDSPVWFDHSSTVGWVRIADITNAGRFLNETTQRLSSLGVKESRPVAAGSLIMSICATVGRPIITNIDVCIHDGFVVFGKLETDQMFIYYVLKWIEPDWSKHGQTGSQMNLNTGLINDTKIKLPCLSEQTVIATVLSDMDALLDSLDRLIAKKRDIKQAAMVELLTGKTRLPGFEGEWERVELKKHISFLRNGVNSRAELTVDDPVKYLHYGDIHSQIKVLFAPDNLPSIPLEKARNLDFLQDGDLVFADASEDLQGVSKSVEIFNVGQNTVVAGLHTIAVRFDKSKMGDGFKAYLQFIPEFNSVLRRLASGTKVYATNKSHIEGIVMRLPSLSEQTAIAKVLSDMDAEIEALEVRRTKTQNIKQGMMQELLTGKTRLIAQEG